MKTHGWDKIIPQLASFFVVLRRRPNGLTPFNLFLTGCHGTNKTEGMLELARFLELQIKLVDASTLDDVAELAGVVDLEANRNRGQAKIIEGELLEADILLLDEFLNVRPHVMPQFRLLLQGYLVMLARQVEMKVKAVVATGNLSEDMQEGEANVLDSPTADRFAMVIKVPSLSEMAASDVRAILKGDSGGAFETAFAAAVRGMDERFEQVEAQFENHAIVYVSTLIKQVALTPFHCEGRRAKLLKRFFLAALALCQAQPDRNQKETVWEVARDCLSYHRLSGMKLELANLRIAHEQAFELAMSDNPIEAQLASSNSLEEKMAILVENLAVVNPVTKADVFSQVMECDDTPLKMAVVELVRSPVFAQEPAELKAMAERANLCKSASQATISTEQIVALSQMQPFEAMAFGLAGGDKSKMNAIVARVQGMLSRWKVATV